MLFFTDVHSWCHVMRRYSWTMMGWPLQRQVRTLERHAAWFARAHTDTHRERQSDSVITARVSVWSTHAHELSAVLPIVSVRQMHTNTRGYTSGSSKLQHCADTTTVCTYGDTCTYLIGSQALVPPRPRFQCSGIPASGLESTRLCS
jgi:hypothetical protein